MNVSVYMSIFKEDGYLAGYHYYNHEINGTEEDWFEPEDWSPKEDGTHLMNAWKLAGDILGAGENLHLRQRETLDAIRAEASAKQMHEAVWDFNEIEALRKAESPCLILCSEDDVMYPFLNKVKVCRPDAIVEIIKGKNLEPDLDAKNISVLLMEFLEKI